MKPIIQQDVTGCAIASTAALAGVTYPVAKKVANSLSINASNPTLWSSTSYIRQLLKHYNSQASLTETLFKNWQSLPDRALLAIKWQKRKANLTGIGACLCATPITNMY